MSKIALIAATASGIEHWRRASGIGPELAPWITTLGAATQLGPFCSVLCMTDWRDRAENPVIYEYIVAQITAARLGEDQAGEERLVMDVALDEPRNRPGAAVAFPSTPPLSENERVLRDFGVNPALIGMLEDEMLNSIAASIRQPSSNRTGLREAIDMLARRRGIPAWAETISASEVRQEALRIVQEFYGTNAHFQTMNDSRLFVCRDIARRGNSAMPMIAASDVVDACRNGIARILTDHREEQQAGFLDPETGPPAERTPDDGFEPPAYRPQPRAYSDPLRDHLRTYMQQERRTPRRRHSNDGF